ncbi:hypothetical protein RIF29_38878 [Crotalaria pallida]|uniref:Uncharacterized protein n=1 Tax=Crotalaria pallida TaxID=3830 RepID=A0AAN9E5K1_CROPI
MYIILPPSYKEDEVEPNVHAEWITEKAKKDAHAPQVAEVTDILTKCSLSRDVEKDMHADKPTMHDEKQLPIPSKNSLSTIDVEDVPEKTDSSHKSGEAKEEVRVSSSNKNANQKKKGGTWSRKIRESGQWDRGLIYMVFEPFKASHITRIQLRRSVQLDSVIWNLSKDGIYSVKSGYAVALDKICTPSSSSSSADDLINWKRLWSAPCIPRAKDMAWRACKEILPVRKGAL